jgi:hypothetical protein
MRGGRETRATVAGFAVACALSGAFALQHLERPGLNYDEAMQAVQALVFLTDAEPSAIPGLSSTRLLGRWFPLMTQPYMGALKSQALLGPLAIFGPSPQTLRITTWLWTLLALLLTMLWARQVLGLPTALLAGALLALDPSVLFIGRHDWGSFALGFVCRAAALLLLTDGWRRGGGWRLVLGGACLGLGLYNKLDFGIFLLGAGAALWIAAPRGVWRELRARPRRALAAGAGLALGATPLLASLPGALGVGRALGVRAAAGSWQWSEKAVAFATTLDGSYFHRLMLAGGSFEELGAVEGAAAGPFLVLLGAALIFLLLRLVRAPRSDGREPARRFVMAATILTLVGVFLTPRAVRIHHVLNATPLPQLLLAAALVELWQLGAARRALRALAAGLAALALLGSARVDARTLATIVDTGGKGRWSDALGRFASELAPGSVVVSLDWGFAESLRFLTPGLPVVETTWSLRGRRSQLALEGDRSHVYLVPLERYAVFGHGQDFLGALEALPDDVVSVESVADRSGDPAFLAARIAKPHRVDYRRGLVVRLR